MNACEFTPLIAECCAEVLDAMYFTSVLGAEAMETAPHEGPGAVPPLGFSLRFAGDVSGRFGLWMEPAAAHTLAANFLGEEETEITSEEASEVAGELANMFCGSVMSRVEGEHRFVLSHPEAARCPQFGSAGDFGACRLSTDIGDIGVWIAIERDPCR